MSYYIIQVLASPVAHGTMHALILVWGKYDSGTGEAIWSRIGPVIELPYSFLSTLPEGASAIRKLSPYSGGSVGGVLSGESDAIKSS